MNEIGREELLGYLDAFVTSHKLHFNKITPRDTRAYRQIYALISDYDTNLTDCTEAIDALIEERDALIEDSKAYDERVDEIVEHYRRLDSEPSGVDEDMLVWLSLWIEDGGQIGDYGTDEDREMYARIKQLLSQKRVVSREELSDLACRMKERAEVGSLTLTNYHAVIKWVARELGIEVADNTQNPSSHGRNGVNEADK